MVPDFVRAHFFRPARPHLKSYDTHKWSSKPDALGAKEISIGREKCLASGSSTAPVATWNTGLPENLGAQNGWFPFGSFPKKNTQVARSHKLSNCGNMGVSKQVSKRNSPFDLGAVHNPSAVACQSCGRVQRLMCFRSSVVTTDSHFQFIVSQGADVEPFVAGVFSKRGKVGELSCP